MSLLSHIEQKISDATAQLKQHSDLLTQIGAEIERLTANKSATSQVIHQLNGFLVACQDLKKVAEEGKADIVDAVDAVKAIPEAVKADVSEAVS